MKLHLILLFFLASTVSTTLAQTRVSGTITDNTTNDPLFGATIAYDGKGIIKKYLAIHLKNPKASSSSYFLKI